MQGGGRVNQWGTPSGAGYRRSAYLGGDIEQQVFIDPRQNAMDLRHQRLVRPQMLINTLARGLPHPLALSGMGINTGHYYHPVGGGRAMMPGHIAEYSDSVTRDELLMNEHQRQLVIASGAYHLHSSLGSSSGSAAIPPPPPEEEEEEMEGSAILNAETASSLTTVGALPSIKVVKNDYNQHFVDTGERPQNFIRDHEPHLRFTEYPKLERLIRLKDELNKQRAHPPVHIRADFKTFDWSSLGTNFDVILVDPPWREYTERLASSGGVVTQDLTPWTLDDVLKYLRVDKIAETPSFCFIWCGSQHLDDGRQLLQAWGFRRCEDICWLKTNKIQIGRGVRSMVIDSESGLFQHTKEHCLMGVKGVVRRSQDTHFIHSNIDADVIVEEEPTDSEGRATASTAKPTELYDIIERFCLGKRKIELFGLDRNIRRGWLTLGQEISVTNFDRPRYLSWVTEPSSNECDHDFLMKGVNTKSEIHKDRYMGSSIEIEQLRPKSPPRSAAPSRSSAG